MDFSERDELGRARVGCISNSITAERLLASLFLLETGIPIDGVARAGSSGLKTSASRVLDAEMVALRGSSSSVKTVESSSLP